MSAPIRCQRGQYAPLDVVIGTGMPFACPVASVTDPNNALFGTYPLPYVGLTTPGGFPRFHYDLYLPGGASLGTYQVAISYQTSGGTASESTSFTVVAGGDSGGSVISMYAYVRPEAKYVLAQLSSGKLVQGRNPHL